MRTLFKKRKKDAYLIPKVSLKDESIQTYLHTQQSKNLSNAGLKTNYKQLQHSRSHPKN